MTTFTPERADADDKFAVHGDGKMPFTAYGGVVDPLSILLSMNGDVPDPAALEAALDAFPWRDDEPQVSNSGACMLSTPMKGVFLEVMPRAPRPQNRLGFSISGSLHEEYLAELDALNENRWPGHRDRVERIWSDDPSAVGAALAEARALKGTSPSLKPFQTRLRGEIAEALKVTLIALNEAVAAVPDRDEAPAGYGR